MRAALLLLPLAACDACPLSPPAGVCSVVVPSLQIDRDDVEAGGWGNNSEYVENLDGTARFYVQQGLGDVDASFDFEAFFDAPPDPETAHRWPRACDDAVADGGPSTCDAAGDDLVGAASGQARVDADEEPLVLTALAIDVAEVEPRFVASFTATYGEAQFVCDYDVYADAERDPSSGGTD